jgi:hypothetical protein
MREEYVAVKFYFENMSKIKHDIRRLINVELQQGMVFILQERQTPTLEDTVIRRLQFCSSIFKFRVVQNTENL